MARWTCSSSWVSPASVRRWYLWCGPCCWLRLGSLVANPDWLVASEWSYEVIRAALSCSIRTGLKLSPVLTCYQGQRTNHHFLSWTQNIGSLFSSFFGICSAFIKCWLELLIFIFVYYYTGLRTSLLFFFPVMMKILLLEAMELID